MTYIVLQKHPASLLLLHLVRDLDFAATGKQQENVLVVQNASSSILQIKRDLLPAVLKEKVKSLAVQNAPRKRVAKVKAKAKGEVDLQMLSLPHQ